MGHTIYGVCYILTALSLFSLFTHRGVKFAGTSGAGAAKRSLFVLPTSITFSLWCLTRGRGGCGGGVEIDT